MVVRVAQSLGTMEDAPKVDENATLYSVSCRNARADDVPEWVGSLADDVLHSRQESLSDPGDVSYADTFATIETDPSNPLVVADVDHVIAGMLQITFIPSLSYR